MKNKSLISVIIAILLGVAGFGGGTYLGVSDSERVVNYQVAGTSTSSPLSIGSSATTTAYISSVENFTQFDLNSVANVSTTETISIKTNFSVEDNCASNPTGVNWFNASTTSITADGNKNFNITNNLLAKCVKLEIYNATSTVTSTLFLQATLR